MSKQTFSPFAIERGVPMPANAGRGRKLRYPWREMEIGDSILVPCAGTRKVSVQRNLIGSYTRCKPRTFSTAQVEGGIRVWRTA